MRLTLKVFLFVFIYLGIPSCQDSDDCPPNSPNFSEKVRVSSLDSLALFKEDLRYTYGATFTACDSGTIPKKSRIALFFKPQYRPVAATLLEQKSWGTMGGAYACSPSPPPPPTVTKLPVNITISSTGDINEQYPAGADLRPLFSTPSDMSIVRDDYAEMLRRSRSVLLTDLVPLNEFLEEQLDAFLTFQRPLLLQTATITDSKHVFTLKLSFADTTLSASSREVVFK